MSVMNSLSIFPVFFKVFAARLPAIMATVCFNLAMKGLFFLSTRYFSPNFMNP